MTTYHVLLADDDVSITKGLSDILRGYFPGCFTLHCASSGLELKNCCAAFRLHWSLPISKCPE